MKLDNLRKQIDEIDNKIIDSISIRFQLAKKIMHEKRKLKLKITDEKRESEVWENVRKLSNNHNINHNFINKLYCLIISESIRIQK
jgi:chorismate mutase